MCVFPYFFVQIFALHISLSLISGRGRGSSCGRKKNHFLVACGRKIPNQKLPLSSSLTRPTPLWAGSPPPSTKARRQLKKKFMEISLTLESTFSFCRRTKVIILSLGEFWGMGDSYGNISNFFHLTSWRRLAWDWVCADGSEARRRRHRRQEAQLRHVRR